MPDQIDHDSPPIPAAVWQRVLVVMERLAASSDLGEILSLIIDSLRDCLDAERASVFQYDHATAELFATQAHGVNGSLRFPLTRGLAGDAARTRTIINTPDCYADPRFNPEVDHLTGFRTRTMLTVPLLSFGGHLEGVAQVLNKRGTGVPPVPSSPPNSTPPNQGQDGPATHGPEARATFTTIDETIARALASQAAVAIRRAVLIDAERRKNKIEADLRIARDIQQATLPAALPSIPGYDLAASTIPAEETGGDTYDLLLLPRPGTPGSALSPLLLLMADATGHGIGPALSVTQLQSMLRLAASLSIPLRDTVHHINARLAASLPLGRFITAFFGILDPATHTLEYLSCGQSPILILRARHSGSEGAHEQRDADTLALGIDPDLVLPAPSTLTLGRGDALLLLSDGYYEHRTGALAKPSAALGVAGVLHAARQAMLAHGASASHILEALSAAATGTGAGTGAAGRGGKPADDQTAIILVRT